MSAQQASMGPTADLFQEFGQYGPYVLTKSGSLIAAIELSGREPDGLTGLDFRGLSLIARNIFQGLPREMTITQYYAHFDNAKITLAPREHPVCRLLSERRASFLNQKKLTASRLVHYFEIAPDESLSKLNILGLCKHLGLALFDANSRAVLKRHFSAQKSIVCYWEELERQKATLDSVLNQVTAKWSSISDARILSLQEIWAHMRFLANMDPSLLDQGLREEIPDEHWDAYLAEGDREPVNYHFMDALKFHDAHTNYVRMAAITRFGERAVTPGMWASDPDSPVRQSHNYVLMMRFKPLSKIQQSMLFRRGEDELNRANMNFIEMVSGNESKSLAERNANMKPAVAAKMQELYEAEMVEDAWGMAQAYVAIFDHDGARLKKTSDDLRKSIQQSGFMMCWESAGLPEAYQSFMPGGASKSIRNVPFTTTQLGATSLIFKSSDGQPRVKDLGGEEAQYIFQSDDGTPFHYNPFVGGRGMIFGVGPIRSGKSFTKNTLAMHFMKYGGLFRAIDIDPGAEPIAQAFAQDGSIFRVEGARSRGFNPFAVARGEKDTPFINHLKNLIIQMMATNDSDDLRRLESYEQRELDEAILATLRLPKHLQRLSTVANHCSKQLAQKMQRWVDEGMYAHLFDQPKDSMSSLDHPVAVFNLAGVKDDSAVLPLIMTEVFYRITRAFEDPDYRLMPKYLDIDEAHALLKIPYIAQYIVRSVRTWGKWRAGIGLWSQSPKEFLDLPDWSALRSAASGFFFMADPHMDQSLYQQTFGLTPGECEAIRNLVPKREAYIIQPELGVSKKVILEVEHEQYVLSTSSPHEAELRRRNIEHYGFVEGVQRTMRDLGLMVEKQVPSGNAEVV